MNPAPGFKKRPDHRIVTKPAGQRVQVKLNGQLIADSGDALLLEEGTYAPVYYFPRKDVKMDRLLRSSHSTHCPFKVNQLGHPYQGSIYHGLARSAGLGFWESMGYTFAGSMIWEIAGEDTLPSKNDQIASGIAGSFLGESLFRMASLVLEKGEGHRFWREVAAAAISPATGFNRVAFHDRFSEVLNSKNPAYYGRVQVGASGTVIHQAGNSTDVKINELLVDYSMDYGLPGKPGYHYDRPWDYFSFQISASSANAVESMSTRGLLFRSQSQAGHGYGGACGRYGGYENC